MGPKRDPRTHAQKAVIGWNHTWTEEKDMLGDKIWLWAERVDNVTYRCRWCNKVCVCGSILWATICGRLVQNKSKP